MLSGSIHERLELEDVCERLEDNTRRLTSLMRNVSARDSPAIGTWTVHDVALHVTDGMESYAKRIKGEPAPELDAIRSMAQWNVETVKQLTRVPLPELADRMAIATTEFIKVARALESDQRVPWYAGFTVPVVVSVALRLVEHVIHGYDIAMGAEASWPVDRDDAVAMTYAVAYTSPHFVDSDRLNFEGTIELRLRGEAPFYFVIEDRELRVQLVAKRVGFHLWADPVAWVLVSTGRTSRLAAGVTGKIVGWGPRPLLPFKLQAASFRG